MNYLRIQITIPDEYHEYLIAELMDLDFYGFEQNEGELTAYVEKPRFDDANREAIEILIGSFPGASFREFEEIEEVNWNQKWENTIKPQKIGRFLVCPGWDIAEVKNDEILLIVEPKMAFGTGYHETTRLMLRTLQELDCEGKTALDAGTGTGILAIAALKLGAEKAVGFDYDPLCIESAAENGIKNKVVSKLDIRLGGTEQIRDDEQFDITLANINRNVIIEFLDDFVKFTKPGGILCLSGLLKTDEEMVLKKTNQYPLKLTNKSAEGEWISLCFAKGDK